MIRINYNSNHSQRAMIRSNNILEPLVRCGRCLLTLLREEPNLPSFSGLTSMKQEWDHTTSRGCCENQSRLLGYGASEKTQCLLIHSTGRHSLSSYSISRTVLGTEGRGRQTRSKELPVTITSSSTAFS